MKKFIHPLDEIQNKYRRKLLIKNIASCFLVFTTLVIWASLCYLTVAIIFKLYTGQ